MAVEADMAVKVEGMGGSLNHDRKDRKDRKDRNIVFSKGDLTWQIHGRH